MLSSKVVGDLFPKLWHALVGRVEGIALLQGLDTFFRDMPRRVKVRFPHA